MEKQINLEEIGRDIFRFRDFPEKLDGINLKLAGWYSYYSAKMIPLELAEAKFWQDNKNLNAEKPVSDAMVRALWKITPDGYKMIEVERTLKTCEKLMSTLRTSISRADRELRNIQ